MTAAPGPQQPDEVCTCTPGAPECRKCATSFPAAPSAQPDEVEHVCDDYETDDITRWVDEMEDRPAAPSAQPDEESREATPAERRMAQQFLAACGHLPAQPVRDTEEGRR